MPVSGGTPNPYWVYQRRGTRTLPGVQRLDAVGRSRQDSIRREATHGAPGTGARQHSLHTTSISFTLACCTWGSDWRSTM